MLTLLTLLMEWLAPTQYRNWRYGARFDPTDLNNGQFGVQNPSPESAARDYFRENSPSAKKANPQGTPYYQEPYVDGQEEVGANMLSVISVIVLISVFAFGALYLSNSSFHGAVDAFIHR
jgi:hypothetical protein